jgi:hypothetical protein
MPADLYRDAHLGIRARVGELAARIREREAEVTEEFWASLDHHVREHLSALRRSVDARCETLDELAHAESHLSAYVEELDRLIACLPSMEEEWLALPEHVSDPPPAHSALDTALLPGADDELVRSFRAIVRERSRDAEVVVDGVELVARFRHREAPFSLRATALRRGLGQVGDVLMQLVTSVARASPKLLVQQEPLFASVGKSLGFWRDIEVGDTNFDGLFLIQGTRETVQRLLVPSIRGLLLALARFDVPTLEIDPPNRTASLTWCFEPKAPALDAAVRVLSFIRDAEAEVRFRR